MNRRSFLLTGSSFIALVGCDSTLNREEVLYRSAFCNNAGVDREFPILVDAHCHLLNAKDTDPVEFVARRIVDVDANAKSLDGNLLGEAIRLAQNRVPRIEVEKDRIRDFLKERSRRESTSTNELCAAALSRHHFRLAGNDERLGVEGFLSSRIKNAADMMRNYSNFDLFLPSIIDFVEGNHSPNFEQEARFYSMLSLATDGRFLPLISFSPERQFIFERDETELDFGDGVKLKYLDYIRMAIEELGFVGVKVHPSSGWAPFRNTTYGCLNSRGQIGDIDNGLESERETFDRFKKYDEYIRDLMVMCMQLDVPILTHCTPGLDSNKACMRGERPEDEYTTFSYNPEEWVPADPIDWTGSPKQWTYAIDATLKHIKSDPILSADARLTNNSPKIILAHLADAFVKPKRNLNQEWEATDWLKFVKDVWRNYPSIYMDTSELSEMVDTSSDDPTLYAGARRALNRLSHNRNFQSKALYGSDWHMPGVSVLGQAYPTMILNALNASTRENVFGANAIRVFGLNEGGENRKRLEKFFAAPPVKLFGGSNADLTETAAVPLELIPWWEKSLEL